MPTRSELKRAMRQATLPIRERYVLDALIDRADNLTGEIPARFQPRSHDDEYFFGASRRTVQRALLHLRKHGWIDWEPVSQGKRGRPPNRYVLDTGWPCNCPIMERIKRQPDAESGGIERQTSSELSARMPELPQPAAQIPLEGREGEQVGKGVESLLLCAVCQTPLDPVLPAAGYRTHPCCDPDEKPGAAWAA